MKEKRKEKKRKEKLYIYYYAHLFIKQKLHTSFLLFIFGQEKI
jgi:hypothetical protein